MLPRFGRRPDAAAHPVLGQKAAQRQKAEAKRAREAVALRRGFRRHPQRADSASAPERPPLGCSRRASERRRRQDEPAALHPRGRSVESFATASPRFSAHRIPFLYRGESGNILMRSARLFRRLCAFQVPKPVSGQICPCKPLMGEGLSDRARRLTLVDMPLLARQWRGDLADVPETVGHFGASFGGRDFPIERSRAATSFVSSSPSRPPQARRVSPNPFSIPSSLLRLISPLPIARSAALFVRGTSRRRRWHNGARHFSLSAARGRLAERGGSPSGHESGSPSAHPPGLVAAPDSLRAPPEGFSRSRSVGIGQL